MIWLGVVSLYFCYLGFNELLKPVVYFSDLENFIHMLLLSDSSCIFSVLVSKLFICNSILFSRFWIIFIIIILNSFSDSLCLPLWFGLVGFYHVPLPAEYFSAFSSFLVCWVWGGLSLGWKFVVPLYCGGSFLWVGWKSGLSRFPVREVCVSVLVGGWSCISFLWSAMKCPVESFEVSMGLVWLLTACSCVLRVMFLYCWRISLVCLALKLVGSWVELGFSVGMEALGWASVT